MRVLHCIWRTVVGGAERQLLQLSAALTRRNIDVHVATAIPGPLDDALRDAGATVHPGDAMGSYDPVVGLRLAMLIRRLRPDVVQSWLTQMDLAAGAAVQVARVPWILSERNSREAYFPSVLHGLRRRFGAHTDFVVANSEAGADYWRELIGDRVCVIPNIVTPPDATVLPTVAMLPTAGDVVLSAASFRDQKNLSRVLDALALALCERDFLAVFCGEGPQRGEIQSAARRLGVSDRILFPGLVSDVRPWMRRASVMVAASLFEGEPNAVLEAVAVGTPLVVSDIEAHRAFLSERSARFVDPHSAISIAEGVRAVLADPQGARARAAVARELIHARNAGRIAALYEDAYRRVVEDRRR